MGLPSISIEFIKKAVSAIQIGTGGVVGIILSDAANIGALVMKDVSDIPDGFAPANRAYLERAFYGAPKKVVVYTFGTTTTYQYTEAVPEEGDNPKTKGWYEAGEDGAYKESTDTEVVEGKAYYTRTSTSTTTTFQDAMKFFKNTRVNFLCGMPEMTSEQAVQLATWCKGVRANTPNRPIVVVANTAADFKGVVNFSVPGGADGGAKITAGQNSYTEAEYCSRIAGLLAGLPYTVSATYKPLTEVTAIPEVDPEDVDAAVDAGKLALYNNGDQIVIARGVTSLTTVTQEETEDLKKIKIVCIQDLIETDIYTTINSAYIGNYTNSYDNKILLVTAISAYLKKLEAAGGGAGYLNPGSTMEIDVASQRLYLEGKGIDASDMDEMAIKEANTDSWVFLNGTVSILDAIEDVKIRINKI